MDMTAGPNGWGRKISDQPIKDVIMADGFQRRYRYFISGSGLLGFGPLDAQIGDTVHVLFGSNWPFILRDVEGRHGCHKYVGHAYVHGIMDGEAMREGRAVERVTLL